MVARAVRACFRALSCVLAVVCGMIAAFNLDLDKPSVYSGPEGSYFGYSVDFYHPTQDRSALAVLVGAPKANTSQPGIVEGGAVYYCPWPSSQPDSCRQIPFDKANNRMIKVNGTREPLEFKSHQWFGATVRTHRGKVVACAPLYHWRTVKMSSEMDPVGTCYVAVQNFSAYAEYSPCRTNNPDPEGQGFCQAGFSVDFTKEGTLVVGGPGSFYWQGQVITAGVAEILNGYSLKAVLRKVQGEKQTGAASDAYDDSYLGYSVAVGEFTGDSQQEGIAGVPRGAQSFGYVAVINSTNLTFIQNFTGEQMASYFGYTVAVTDLNGDGLDDVLVGAPLYMDREFESKPREVGRIYLYLQEDALLFSPPITLTGTHVFGRYGSAIAPLGDVNQDGYLDVAVGAPFAGDDRRGLVFIYNGQRSGLKLKASQVLSGAWASSAIPAGFGFTLRGDSDLDGNQYPDLIVGAFGAGKVVVYRARPVVTVDAQLLLTPQILNPEDKSCHMPNSDIIVPCLRVDVCAKVSGIGIPDRVAVSMELQLDWLKQRGAVKRVLFLDSHQHHRTLQLLLGQQDRRRCLNHTIYLRDEAEFRDKLSPISVALNYSLDQTAPLPGLQLQPILDHYSMTFHQEQANILLDCGDDNMCIPDLKLSAKMDHTELVIGDDNPLLLTINAANHGEGAYEAELQVRLPPEADYNGMERRREDLQILNCEHRVENESQVVVCDLGNPMPAGANVSIGLRFSVRRLEDADAHIGFELQVLSSNKDNSKSNPVNLTLNVVARADVDIRGVSLPAQVVLPFPRWEPKEKPVREDDIGPQVQHIYELHNKGPSSLSGTVLEVGWPSRHREEHLLYAMQIITDGPIHCHANGTLNPLELETSTLQDTPELLGFLRNSSSPTRRRRSVTSTQSYSSKTLNCSNIHCLMLKCIVGRLDQGQSAVVKVRSRLWAHTFLQRRNDHYLLNSTVSFQVTGMPYRIKPHTLPQQSNSIGTFVVWAIPDVSFAIPLWVIILAILLGLLVLAILTLAMWKCGFFDRARPPKDDDVSDREQLTAEKSTEA
ncbi:integrin alpha-8 [Colossoma macropomum]|uniref:integrin alpha-8 n=1 Tax=Colossoma macropomum TaxID=42526 RepID=UPI00186433FC|nr:integrin alpha-8 [Colossoma macropomum]